MDHQFAKQLQTQMCAGTWNLLHNCLDLQPDESLLLVCEDSDLGWYDQKVAAIINTAAEKFGVAPTIIHVGQPGNEPVPDLIDAIAAHDCVIYLARVGDQSRFDEIAAGKRSVMCYLRDKNMLASPFCQTAYPAIRAFKQAIDDILVGARTIDITCPLGTSLSGSLPAGSKAGKSDVSVFRFPLGVPQPMTASYFSGQVAIADFLTPTGSRVYQPASVALSKTTYARISNGRITGFEGQADNVKSINDHYDHVAKQFGIDRDIVHS
ncbi:MAG TPA: hypothetical protein ENJ55_07725, partial [Rhizobiales bacterium]|nr:hypothetical protein [Hyphomicrobiales bacterium]